MTELPTSQGRPISACRRCRQFKVRCDRKRPKCTRCSKASASCDYGTLPRDAKPTSKVIDVNAVGNYSHEACSSPSTPDSGQVEGNDAHLTGGSGSSIGNTSKDKPKAKQYQIRSAAQVGKSRANGKVKMTIADRVKLSRDRAILSCLRCRKHKVRCDRTLPCAKCIKSKKEAHCVYVETDYGSGRSISTAHQNALSLIATRYIDPRWNSALRNGTHWNALLTEMKSYLPLDHAQQSGFARHYEEFTSAITPSINYPFSGSPPGSETVERILSQLPPRAVQESFVAQYMNTVEKAYRLLDITAFQEELEGFWADPVSKEDDWLAQYLLILCLGCQAHNYVVASTEDQVYEGLPGTFLLNAECCLKRTPYLLMATPANIRTLCLVVVAKQIYTMSCHEADSCWPLTGLIIRLSIRIGLHQSYSFGSELEPYDNSVKARLWATALFLEMRQSLVCGMPLLMRPADISPTSREGIGNVRKHSQDHESLLVRVFAASSDLLFRGIELATRPNDSVTYDEVVEVDTCMREQLYESGIGLPNGDFGIEDSVDEEVNLESCMVQIFFRQILMAIHARFALQPMSSTDYPVSYVSSLESALAILSHQRNLCEGDKWGQKSAWFAGFFRHEFFTASMTVCRHLVLEIELMVMSSSFEYYTQPQMLMLDALQSCRDVFRREKTASVCGANTFAIVDNFVRILIASQEQYASV